LKVAGWVIKDAEHIPDKKPCDRESHASKTLQEEGHRLGNILIKIGRSAQESENACAEEVEPGT